MITFAPFRAFFEQAIKADGNKMSRLDLKAETKLSNDTISRIFNDGNVTTETIDRLCRTYHLQLHEVIGFTDRDDAYQALLPGYSLRPGFCNDRIYPHPLPAALRVHYAYPQAAGHSIMCLLAALRSDWEHANRLDHVVPLPVQYVLSVGWTVDEGWIVVDAPYQLRVQPDIEPDKHEFS